MMISNAAIVVAGYAAAASGLIIYILFWKATRLAIPQLFEQRSIAGAP